MKTMMLATDFSERSDRALSRATLLARQMDASLTIVHVVEADQPPRLVESAWSAATARLEELRQAAREAEGISCETRALRAAPFAGIAEAAQREAPDLLVLGAHRRQALRDVFAGTTAERTIREVDCPVLMVNAAPASAYSRILLATDLGEGSAEALRALVALGIPGGARLSLLHVYAAPPRTSASPSAPPVDWAAHLEMIRDVAAARLAEFAQQADVPGREQILRHGLRATAEEILLAARESSADLIVVGTQGRRGLGRFFLGSVAEEVLRGADCDVLAFPPARTH